MVRWEQTGIQFSSFQGKKGCLCDILNQVLTQQNAIRPKRYTKNRFCKIDKHAIQKQLTTIKDQRIADYEFEQSKLTSSRCSHRDIGLQFRCLNTPTFSGRRLTFLATCSFVSQSATTSATIRGAAVMAVIPVTRSHLHQMRWTLSTALRGRSLLSPAILRATRSTMMGARTPSTPASNLTVYRIAWWWASSSSSSSPRKDRIDPNAQEQKENCQNADFHIAFLSVVCLVISFTQLDLSNLLDFFF